MNNSRNKLIEFVKKHAELIYSILILWIATFVLLVISIWMNGSKMIYSYDDAYIHMAMAKNFAKYGVWGISKFGFTSSSSSILWTSLLALIYFIIGANEITPLILNIVISTVMVISIYFILKREFLKPFYISVSLAALILLTPLPPLIMTGLEHPLHILVSILFIYIASGLITKARAGYMNVIWLVMLSMMLPSIRYEGLVLVLVTAFLLLIRKQWKLSILMIIFSVLPIYLYGIISLKKGWSFFPNSLLLKGDLPDIVTFNDFYSVIISQWSKVLYKVNLAGTLIISVLVLSLFVVYFRRRSKAGISGDSSNRVMFILLGFVIVLLIITQWSQVFFNVNFINTIILFVLFVLLTMLYYRRFTKVRILDNENTVMLVLLGINIVLYVLFSRTGWSYRYQSFLVALSVFVISIILFRHSSTGFSYLGKLRPIVARFLFSVLLLALGVYFLYGGIMTLIQTPQMTTNIYEQQYQMAMFLNRYYENKTVALNDIGACNYFADIHCVDLWGLGDLEISRKRRYNTYGVNDIREIAHVRRINIAIVYDSWFTDSNTTSIPPEWIKVGEWEILNNIVAGDNKISFYAADINDEKTLLDNLKVFSRNLPSGVIQSGKYKERL